MSAGNERLDLVLLSPINSDGPLLDAGIISGQILYSISSKCGKSKKSESLVPFRRRRMFLGGNLCCDRV